MLKKMVSLCVISSLLLSVTVLFSAFAEEPKTDLADKSAHPEWDAIIKEAVETYPLKYIEADFTPKSTSFQLAEQLGQKWENLRFDFDNYYVGYDVTDASFASVWSESGKLPVEKLLTDKPYFMIPAYAENEGTEYMVGEVQIAYHAKEKAYKPTEGMVNYPAAVIPESDEYHIWGATIAHFREKGVLLPSDKLVFLTLSYYPNTAAENRLILVMGEERDLVIDLSNTAHTSYPPEGYNDDFLLNTVPEYLSKRLQWEEKALAAKPAPIEQVQFGGGALASKADDSKREVWLVVGLAAVAVIGVAAFITWRKRRV